MRFSNIFALGALLVPAFASPILDKSLNGNKIIDGNEVEALNDNNVNVAALNSFPSAPHHERGDSPYTSGSQIKEALITIVAEVKVCTQKINETVVDYGKAPSDDHKEVIKEKFQEIVDILVKFHAELLEVDVKINLGVLVADVTIIVACLVELITEIVCTLVYVLAKIDIALILKEVIVALCVVIKDLLLILELLIGNICATVIVCLNLSGVLALCGTVLVDLFAFLSGVLHGVIDVSVLIKAIHV